MRTCRHRRARALGTCLAGVAALLLAGCAGSPSGSDAGAATATAGGAPKGRITVLAAASLTESFTEIARRFEAEHPGTSVRLSFGGSPALATQVVQGAPADVLASASTTTMDRVVEAGLVEPPAVFARNVMEIAVPDDDPGRVGGPADLGRPGVKVALCQVEVPCGAAAARVLDAAGVRVEPVTREEDVRATLAKVSLGEVDAALVYATDVRAAGPGVRGVPIPEDVNATTDYPVAVLRQAPNALVARAFVAEVLSEQGRRILRENGFRTP